LPHQLPFPPFLGNSNGGNGNGGNGNGRTGSGGAIFENEADFIRNYSADEAPRRRAAEPTESDILRAKHTMLIQLNSLQSQGIILTKQYTMYDDVDEIHFEVLRQQNIMDCATTVDQWMVYIILLVFIIEWINAKLGSPLYFNKVGEYMKDKIESLRVPLRRCYHRYVHSQASNPILDVLKAVAAILFGYHMQNLLGMGHATEAPPRPDARPAPGRTAAPAASSSLFSLLPMMMKTFGGFGGTETPAASSTHRPFSSVGARDDMQMPPEFPNRN